MRRVAVALAAVAALAACSSKDKPADDPKPKRIDARPRPDAGPPPDAEPVPDAGPRPYVERVPCPYDRQELENAARASWGPPPDAGVEVQCATAAAPMAAWVLWGHAGLDNRFEIHRTIVKASPGHSVLGDNYHRTTDRKETDTDTLSETIYAHDLDDDGIDELLLVRSLRPSRYAMSNTATLTVYALRNGALIESPVYPIQGKDCPGEYDVYDRTIEITGRVDRPGDPSCAPKGSRRYAWDSAALTLTPTER